MQRARPAPRADEPGTRTGDGPGRRGAALAAPFGVGYYSARAVSRVEPEAGIRPLIGYLIALFIGVVIIALVPWFSTGFL